MDQFLSSNLLVSAVPIRSVELRDSSAGDERRRGKRSNPKPANADEDKKAQDEEESHVLDILA